MPNAFSFAKSSANNFSMGTHPMPSELPKVVPAASYARFSVCCCRQSPAGHGNWRWSRSRRPSLAIYWSTATHDGLRYATTEAQRCTIPDPHGAHLVSASCHTADPRPAVYSRTASRVGVSR